VVIRPVLEYAAPVWNHLLTKRQIDQIEAIQKLQRRSLRIIYSYTNDMPYTSALYCAAIPSLPDHREHLTRKFFKSVRHPSSCLFNLLPTPWDPSIITHLRFANKFPRIPTRTRKYQTFISHAVCHYQSQTILCLLCFLFVLHIQYTLQRQFFTCLLLLLFVNFVLCYLVL